MVGPAGGSILRGPTMCSKALIDKTFPIASEAFQSWLSPRYIRGWLLLPPRIFVYKSDKSDSLAARLSKLVSCQIVLQAFNSLSTDLVPRKVYVSSKFLITLQTDNCSLLTPCVKLRSLTYHGRDTKIRPFCHSASKEPRRQQSLRRFGRV